MLVSEIIDRTYSEWLEPAGALRPAWDTVATQGVLTGSGEGTFTVAGRVANIPSDTIIEIDDELILVTSVSSTTITTAGRGYRETSPASHTVGTRVLIDPKFTRVTLFNALSNIIQRLYAKGLYRRVTNSAFNWDTRQVQALDANVLDVLDVTVKVPGSYEVYTAPLMEGRDYRVHYEFTPPKLRMLMGGYQNQAVTVITKQDFTVPTTMSDNLDSLGIPTTLQPSLPMAVAGWLLQGKETVRTQIDTIQRALASQNIQPGTSVQLGESLLNQFWNGPVADELRRTLERDPTRIAVRKTG